MDVMANKSSNTLKTLMPSALLLLRIFTICGILTNKQKHNTI